MRAELSQTTEAKRGSVAAAYPTTPAQQDGPSPAAIREHLTTLFEDDGFRASARRKKLLTYLVEETLAGHGARLKGFDLAVAVLGRDERFDPQNDAIVRVEVGKLRRDLEQYYSTAGAAQPIRIEIPKGHYAPTFSSTALETEPEPTAATPALTGLGWLRGCDWRAPAAVAGSCILLLVGVWLWGHHWHPGDQGQQAGPAVVVLPFEPLGGGDGGQLLASGLTADLIADLMRFDGLQVFAGLPSRQGGVQLPPAAVGVPAFIVAGSVERGNASVRVAARLTDRQFGQVHWSETYDRPLSAGDVFDVQTELSGAIVARLAAVYGVIAQATTVQLRRAQPETLFAYDCVQRAFAYRRTFAADEYAPVRVCLEESVRRDPGYAAAWSMLAFAHLDAGRFGFVEPAAQAGELRAGLEAAQRAVELAPGSVRALQSLAALLYGNGEFDEAEQVQRRAVALNPNNPESLAQLGWRLALHGRSDEGRALLQKAISRSVVVPTWYHTTLALALYVDGELEQARAAAELGQEMCCGVGHATLALTEAAVGHANAARVALDEALRQSTLLPRDPTAFWGNFQLAPDVIDRLNAGLAKAGLQLPPPSGDPKSRS